MNTPRTAPGKSARAGRNLPIAVGVGVGLGALTLLSLLIVDWGWLVLATSAIAWGVWELRQGFASGRIDVSASPLLAGTIAMVPAAYLGGPAALIATFGLTVLVIVCRRVLDGLDGAARDIAGGVFIAAYAPFLASFTALMVAERDGPLRVIAFVLITIASDIGGYAAGVLTGRHPMAPSVSPKKSWEGFGGSAVSCVLVGALTVPLLLQGRWWVGALVGLVVVCLATLGDLTESMLKRDLGVKDFGTVLPGHGGLMDRLDSLLVAAPAVWGLFALLVPVVA